MTQTATKSDHGKCQPNSQSRHTSMSDKPIFVYVQRVVMRGAEHICTACSVTMARRIANALNKYITNQKGY